MHKGRGRGHSSNRPTAWVSVLKSRKLLCFRFYYNNDLL